MYVGVAQRWFFRFRYPACARDFAYALGGHTVAYAAIRLKIDFCGAHATLCEPQTKSKTKEPAAPWVCAGTC
jgi:hypothetical protein